VSCFGNEDGIPETSDKKNSPKIALRQHPRFTRYRIEPIDVQKNNFPIYAGEHIGSPLHDPRRGESMCSPFVKLFI